MKEEGYLILATNRQRYIELALNLALSIRLKDDRPICLVKNKELKLPKSYEKYFDIVKDLKLKKGYEGTTNKILLYNQTPFERSMFIDSDCLLVKNDINLIWNFLKDYSVTSIGKITRNGGFYGGKDLKKLQKLIKTDYMITGYNGGIIYFDRTPKSKKVWSTLTNLYNKKRQQICPTKKGSRHIANEDLLLACALSIHNMRPFPIVFRHNGRMIQWMQCVTGKYNFVYVFRGISYLYHNIRHIESPTIAHFPGINHRSIYLREVNKLRRHFGLPLLPFDFKQKFK
jgi:hypothetical protein